MTNLGDEEIQSLYLLRAEDLDPDRLERWTADTPGDEDILKRLTGAGPKLLKGPRGSGKSTYLRRAYFRLQAKGTVLAAYINYSQHLALEPLMLRSENALQTFRQWLIYKIICALDESLGVDSPSDLRLLSKSGGHYIEALQTSMTSIPDIEPVSPSRLLTLIDKWCNETGRRRAVLLMDDAAHAFMHQQQREFFEVFRSLRSRTVACKAAIYPGVTAYSPYFNVGHEAEEIEVWIRPDHNEYLNTMRAILEARLPAEIRSKFRPEIIDLAAHASFGLPRNFLNIISDTIGGVEEDGDRVETPTLVRTKKAINKNTERVTTLFRDVSKKLPRYENFIQVGDKIYNSMIQLVQSANSSRTRGGARHAGIAISTPWEPDLTQVVSLLEYAGVIRRIELMPRGRETYNRIQIHTSLLITNNAFSLGRNPSAEDLNTALSRQSADDYVRRQPTALMTEERASLCSLNLSPCPTCQSPRVSEDAAFCFKCGSPLTEQSVYRELLDAEIDRLDIPTLKIERIKSLTSIKTIQDILLDDGGVKLRMVPSIGETWSARIRLRATEYVTL